MEYRPLDYPGFEHFLVSENGDVYNSKYNVMATPFILNSGYPAVRLCSDYKRKNFTVHRLVAKAFVDNPNPEKYNIVMHLDNNKLNPNYKNLRWGNCKENMEQCSREGRTHKPPKIAFSDNRKYVIFNKEDCPMCFVNLGLEEAGKRVGLSKVTMGAKSYKQERFCSGQFKDWKINTVDQKTFNGYLSTREAYLP